jgi:hypothetical protein
MSNGVLFGLDFQSIGASAMGAAEAAAAMSAVLAVAEGVAALAAGAADLLAGLAAGFAAVVAGLADLAAGAFWASRPSGASSKALARVINGFIKVIGLKWDTYLVWVKIRRPAKYPNLFFYFLKVRALTP